MRKKRSVGQQVIEDARAKRAKAPDERTFTLNAGEEATLLVAIAEADRGELLPADEVLKQLPVRSHII